MLEDAEGSVTAAAVAHRSAPPGGEDDSSEGSEKIRETVALILLSVTAILTAWCGFEASKWGGEMSIAFSRASAARIEAAKEQGIANNARQQDLTVYGVYLQAEAEGNEQLARYVETRFSHAFKVGFDAWNTSGRTADSPFVVPEYVPPGTKEAQAADERADQLFAQGLINNQRGDNYTLLTVLAALVLFFAAISGRLSRPRLRWAGLLVAGVLFLVGAAIVVTFPVVI